MSVVRSVTTHSYGTTCSLTQLRLLPKYRKFGVFCFGIIYEIAEISVHSLNFNMKHILFNTGNIDKIYKSADFSANI